ncbi:hypothetical protein C6X98_13275 [Bacillus pumilus]|nr:hypothetical protein C6X98_13275 [Bacillus pumilus]
MTLRVRIDQFGRISLPKEIRDRLKIRRATPFEVLVDGDSIILKNNNSTCVVLVKYLIQGCKHPMV